MIRMEITMVDGDKITMPFFNWPDPSAWLEHNRGKYCGVNATQIMTGRR